MHRDIPFAIEYGLPSDRRPRVALVGCGWFALQSHIPALQRLEREGVIELVALCARSDASLARAQQRIGGDRALKQFHHLDQLLSDQDIDFVDLVLPIGQMAPVVRASLRAGKHVISEKPCGPGLVVAAKLVREHGQMANAPFWAVAENWRSKTTTKVVENIVKSGRLGAIHLADFCFVTCSSPNFYEGWRGKPDYPGGHLMDVGVHFIAFLRQVLGEISRVRATVSQRLAHLPPADTATAVLDFENGAQGSFQLSFAAAPYDGRAPTLSLLGANGSLNVELFGNNFRLRNAAGEQAVRVVDDPWVEGGVYETLQHCFAAHRHNAPFRCTPAEALRDIAVREAMLMSSRSGGPVDVASLCPPLFENTRAVSSFQNTWRFAPARVIDCHSVEDVSRAVAAAASDGRRVRAMGVANSWAPELVTTDVCLSTRGLDRILSLDPARRIVSVEAGVRLGDITTALAAHGLCLPSLTFNPNVTIGGAVATATHGTSLRWGTLSDQVAAMTIVTATGQIMRLGPESPPDELRAARVSVGMMGVITSLDLVAEPMPWTRMTETRMALSAFVAERATILARNDYVWGHWRVGDDDIQLVCTEGRATPAEGFVPYVAGEAVAWQSPPPAEALKVPGGGERRVWMSMQYGVPLSDLERVVTLIRHSPCAVVYHGLVIELKFLRQSDASLLGPNACQDSVLFNIYWDVAEDQAHTVLNEFETVMRGLNAAPHWGKYHRVPDLAYMRRAYKLWDRFEAVRSRIDPSGMFSIFPEHWR
jgi:L-gulonolactone oxidase